MHSLCGRRPTGMCAQSARPAGRKIVLENGCHRWAVAKQEGLLTVPVRMTREVGSEGDLYAY